MTEDQADRNAWKKLSSQTMYQSPYFTVREDRVVTAAGKEGVYSVVESKPGVLVIAQTATDEIYLVEAFRYPLQAWRWEVPGGGIEPGDTPLVAAQKELEEELGFRADTWDQLGDMYPSNNGPMNDHNLVFLARDLHVVSKRHEAGEAIRPPQPVQWQKVMEMVQTGTLTDGQSLGALLYYMLWREKQA